MSHAARFHRHQAAPVGAAARLVDGLPAAIDTVAEMAAETHRFLRRQWFAAAVEAYGGPARTIVGETGGVPVLALPLVPLGPRWLGVAAVPGCYWPFRSVPVADHLSDDDAIDAVLALLARHVRALRLGPVHDGDPATDRLVARARVLGWGVVQRPVGESFLLDIAAVQAERPWPRSSTLKKNRFHEKHLAAHGALAWRFVEPDGWPAAFDAMAEVEKRSWLADRTDGSDAKFTRWGHGEFFRAAARDPVIAGMFHAAILWVDEAPAAFSFDLDAGTLKYAIANSYDPAYAKHSPGKLLYYRNLVEAIGRGITRVDWGAGDSGYKRVIGASEGPVMRDWLLLRPGPTARLERLAEMWLARRARGVAQD